MVTEHSWVEAPDFIGYNEQLGGWTFGPEPDGSCRQWWDIHGWTWEDVIDFLEESSSDEQFAILALFPRRLVPVGGAV